MAAQLRKTIGPDFDIMIDMGFSVPLDHAIYLGRAYAEYDLFFLEEPFGPDDDGGFAKLVAVSPTPIATGEKASHEFELAAFQQRGSLAFADTDEFIFHQKVETTGFQPVRYWGRHFWARGYFCATVGQMTEEMIKQYLEHHFEPSPSDEFKMEPP